ncbi:MAG: phospho-sugar mutase [Oscillospiraceae bacterium]|nr:phospho-sugar mutase [Oscillospiraceae bacterium]
MLTDFNLSFGTGGLRGILGEGSDRMNLYTVGRAARGVAGWLGSAGKAVVAYDTRLMSEEFARYTARILMENGIEAILFPRPVPTPVLSFAVRKLAADAGICITASHNPAEYNGFKVYGADGGQITPDDADAITRCILEGAGADAADASRAPIQASDSVLSDYLDAVERLRLTDIPCDNLRVAYTPLNGAGLECVTEVMRRIGAEAVVVPEQRAPDGRFPTCPKPNPEEESALELGSKLCLAQDCDFLLATDPDCDRVGVSVRHQGAMRRLTGNEAGLLLLEYICRSLKESGRLPARPVAVKTIVTSPSAREICDDYGVELRDVLTGFKYIGEQIGLLERDGEAERFIFGFEESCGYLSGIHARDKDGVNAALLICDMAAAYKREGMTLIDGMERLYRRYGRITTLLKSAETGPEAVDSLRKNPPSEIAGRPVLKITDYMDGAEGLTADVLAYEIPEGTVIVRPSGTEPKIKLYYILRGTDDAEQIDADFQRLHLGRDAP